VRTTKRIWGGKGVSTIKTAPAKPFDQRADGGAQNDGGERNQNHNAVVEKQPETDTDRIDCAGRQVIYWR
jgi:hypothetical protein